jgi:hypothetical protein
MVNAVEPIAMFTGVASLRSAQTCKDRCFRRSVLTKEARHSEPRCLQTFIHYGGRIVGLPSSAPTYTEVTRAR